VLLKGKFKSTNLTKQLFSRNKNFKQHGGNGICGLEAYSLTITLSLTIDLILTIFTVSGDCFKTEKQDLCTETLQKCTSI
jgi:hypothetical protein